MDRKVPPVARRAAAARAATGNKFVIPREFFPLYGSTGGESRGKVCRTIRPDGAVIRNHDVSSCALVRFFRASRDGIIRDFGLPLFQPDPPPLFTCILTSFQGAGENYVASFSRELGLPGTHSSATRQPPSSVPMRRAQVSELCANWEERGYCFQTM